MFRCRLFRFCNPPHLIMVSQGQNLDPVGLGAPDQFGWGQNPIRYPGVRMKIDIQHNKYNLDL